MAKETQLKSQVRAAILSIGYANKEIEPHLRAARDAEVARLLKCSLASLAKWVGKGPDLPKMHNLIALSRVSKRAFTIDAKVED